MGGRGLAGAPVPAGKGFGGAPVPMVRGFEAGLLPGRGPVAAGPRGEASLPLAAARDAGLVGVPVTRSIM